MIQEATHAFEPTTALSSPNKEVIGLDISMNEVARVQRLYPADHLIRHLQRRLQREVPAAVVE